MRSLLLPCRCVESRPFLVAFDDEIAYGPVCRTVHSGQPLNAPVLFLPNMMLLASDFLDDGVDEATYNSGYEPAHEDEPFPAANHFHHL